MRTIRLLFIGLACACLLPGPSVFAAKKPKSKPAPAAAAPLAFDPGPAKSLGSAGSWTAYLAQNKSGKVCYLVGQPEKAEPPAAKGKSAMAMVTHRTQDNVSNVVSFDIGVALNEDADVTLDVGGGRFALFAKDETAWAATAELDKAIVAALAKEKRVVINATLKKGHTARDTYALGGFAKALALIDKACDVRR
ncbi:MAG TPA: invasion associated locus B family protein [Stellaceae bacterium]|nr:invasion associated locus B family protein [Stellaceae bacterium]